MIYPFISICLAFVSLKNGNEEIEKTLPQRTRKSGYMKLVMKAK